MAEPPFDLAAAHRWFAVEANNRAWALLEQPHRSAAEDAALLDAAHASAYHWAVAGTAAHAQRAEVLLADAYAAVGLPESASRHARRALALLESAAAELADWDAAFTLDAAARAYAVAGAKALAQDYRRRARAAGDAIADPEDRAAYDAQHARWDWPEPA